MDGDTKNSERRELVDVYNCLLLPLKKELLTIARVIDTTREIILNDANKEELETKKGRMLQ